MLMKNRILTVTQCRFPRDCRWRLSIRVIFLPLLKFTPFSERISRTRIFESIPPGDGELLRSEGSVDVVAFACFFVEDRQ